MKAPVIAAPAACKTKIEAMNNNIIDTYFNNFFGFQNLSKALILVSFIVINSCQ